MGKLYFKIHRSKLGILLAVCDKDICGKTLEDKDSKLELFVNPRFYKESEGGKKEVTELLDHAADANLIGKDAVGLALDLGVIKKEHIKTIAEVPYAIYSVMVG